MTPDAQPDTRLPTVLVVDDNEANRELARQTLEDEGYEIVTASSGAEALALFEHVAPDCVLLDVRMPGLDGFAVCEQIRSNPKGKTTPVIFLTALRDVDTFDHAIRAGSDDFLTKPVRPTELVARVQSALKLQRLSAELHQHYELLKGQRDALMRLQLQKERLMAFVVHDLKSPVNAIDLHAQLMQRDSSLPENARVSVARIRTETRQLGRMVLNLLDLSKADEGKLAPRVGRFALQSVVDDVFAELSPLALSRGLHLVSALEVESIDADEDLFRRMLTNLTENAARHAPRGTEVLVSAKVEGEATLMGVIDRGGGIPVEMRQQIFEPFTQIEEDRSQSSARRGRGLGLAFCKLVADAHGGNVWVEDASPGAAFWVRLPR